MSIPVNRNFMTPRLEFKVALWTALLTVVGVLNARGTTMVRLSLEQLSQASSAIVRGHVVSQESRWNPTHTEIFTLTTLAVDQPVKGNPAGTLVVQQLGGRVGNIHVHVPGAVHFASQKSYVLFLEPARSNPSRYLVVGMMQGAYRIYRDTTTHEERVIEPMGGFFHAVQGGASRQESSAQSEPLTQFKQRVSDAMAAPVVIPPGTAIPLTIQSTESRGVGRLHVTARTSAAIYPTPKTVIPAGSLIEGTALRVEEGWRINWTEVSIRGTRVQIHATSEESQGESLRGMALIVNTR